MRFPSKAVFGSVLAAGALVGAACDYKTLVASCVGSALAFIAHRTFAKRDLEAISAATFRRE